MDPRLREELRRGLIESYKPRRADGHSCAICGVRGSLLAFHLAELAGSGPPLAPSDGVVMSSRRLGVDEGWHGSFPICVGCAPPCKKCGLPTPAERVLDFVDDKRRGPLGTHVAEGNGYCRHIHWSLLVSAVVKRVLRRGRFRPSRPSQPTPTPKRAFDPSILQNFERQIATWPPDQASAALHLIRSTLTSDQAKIDQLIGELTVAQVRAVNEVVRQIHGGN